MADPPGVLVSWGTITDDTLVSVPVLVHRYASGRVRYEDVVSFRSIYIVTGEPSADDDVTEMDVPAGGRPRLITAAILSATRRAMCAVHPYVRPFWAGNPGGEQLQLPENSEISQESALSIGDEEPRRGRTGRQATRFHMHVQSTTYQLCRAGTDRQLPPPPLDSSGSHAYASREYSQSCMFCSGRTFYSPCCSTVFCPRCSQTQYRHSSLCTTQRAYVPVASRYVGGLSQLPPALLLLPHPTWRVCQHLTGDRYTLCSYYDVEDAIYYRACWGIHFTTTLIGRDSAGSWSWVLYMEYRITPTRPVKIRWRVFVAPQFAPPAPALQ